MKKFLVLFVALVLYLGTTVQAATQDEKGRVHVNTQANTEVAPDVVEISFAVTTSDTKSMQNATLENKEISDKLYKLLKTYINPQNGDYIKTSDFSANPVYTYVNSKKMFQKYEVSNRVIVHTKSIEKIGSIIDSAISTGATNVDNLSFSLSNYENQCNDLLVLATQKAKSRADVIAKSLGTSIDGLSDITTSCSANNFHQTRFYMAKNMISDVAAETSSGGVTISNGVIKVTANVNAAFFVKK